MPNHESERERFALVLFYAVVLGVGYLAFQVIGPFLVPMAWAGILAMVLSPLQKAMTRRLGATWAASLITLATLVTIVVPAVLIGTLLVQEVASQVQNASASGLAVSMPVRLQHIWDTWRLQAPWLHLPADPTLNIQEALKSVATFAAGQAASIVANVATFVLQVFITLFALFFFLRDSQAIVQLIRNLLPFEAERRNRIISETYGLVVATVGSTFIVAVTQGALTGVTMGLLGFPAPVFWAVMTAFASLVPAIGAGLIWLPAALWLFVTGEVVKGIILIVVGVGVISLADNVLRPVLLSGRTSMHGLLVFISLLGGVAAFGFIGLVLGPVVVAALSTLVEAAVPARHGGRPPA